MIKLRGSIESRTRMEPERGKSCTVCFDMRLERSALFASENGFRIFTSSFGISRWKNPEQVNACGLRAASRYPDLSIGTITGAKTAEVNAWLKSQNASNFIAKNTAVASIPCAILICITPELMKCQTSP